MITIAILRAAGVSDAQIVKILELEKAQLSSSADRMRRLRANRKASHVTSRASQASQGVTCDAPIVANESKNDPGIQQLDVSSVTGDGKRHNVLSLLREERNKDLKKESTHKRGTRIPAGWTPPDRDWEFAIAAVGEITARANLDKFRDYWTAIPGQKGTKLDWSATWRNWIRRVAESNPAATQQLTEYEERCRNAEIREKQEAEYAAKRYGQKPNGAHHQGELLGGGPEVHQEELQTGSGPYDPTRH